MSDDGFHVHGQHEHEVEHQAHSGVGLAQQIAIFTAVLATLGAIVSYQSGASQNEAMLYKNEAVLKKTKASDEWAFYQAKSSKGHLIELARDLTADDAKKAGYSEQIARYEREKQTLKSAAEALEKESEEANNHSELLLHPHHRQAQAMTLIQIAISLASITALTRKRWLFGVAIAAASGGLALWALSLWAMP